MKLYHHPGSSNARKVVMTALALETALEVIHVDLATGEQRKPDFLHLNPNGQVPVLVDGDFVLTESHAIMTYLCDAKPGNSLYPTGSRERAEVNQWLFWCSAHWSVAVSMLAWEHGMKKMLGLGEAEPALVRRGNDLFAKFAPVLDRHVADKEWVAGGALTIADISLSASLMYASLAKLDITVYPNLARWFSRMQALDVWKQTPPR